MPNESSPAATNRTNRLKKYRAKFDLFLTRNSHKYISVIYVLTIIIIWTKILSYWVDLHDYQLAINIWAISQFHAFKIYEKQQNRNSPNEQNTYLLNKYIAQQLDNFAVSQARASYLTTSNLNVGHRPIIER